MWAARLAVGFVLVGALSTYFSAAPLHSTFGPFGNGTGLLFMAVIAGWWALGTGLSSRGRHLLETALITGATVNATLAILQQLFGFGSIGLGGDNGQPDGVLVNPVHLGAFLAASLVLLAPRLQAEPRRWWPFVAVVGLGLGVDGERLPALLGVAVVVWGAASARRRYRRDQVGGSEPWRRALVFGGLTIGTMIVGSIVAELRGGLGIVSRTASSTASGTFGQRLHAWSDAIHAMDSHTFLGYGPGLFDAAISRFYSLSEIRIDGSDVPKFLDAHNFLLEYATTTGIIGLGLLVGWLVFSVRGRRGPLLGFAAVIAVVELFEPVNVVNTPLALLALGAAVISSGPAGPTEADPRGNTGGTKLPNWIGATGLTLSLLSVIPATLVLIGDVSFESGTTLFWKGEYPAALQDTSTATTLLAPWPDAPWLAANTHAALAAFGQHGQLRQAERWAKMAVSRNPTDAQLWAALAQFQGESGNLGAARESAIEAIKWNPWFAPALDVLGTVEAIRHNSLAAEHLLKQSLEADPSQKGYRLVLSELQRGCTVPRGSRDFSLEITCPLDVPRFGAGRRHDVHPSL